MKMSCEDGIEREFSEEGVPHCAACGRGLDREWRFYVKDGIPYCRGCVLSFPVIELLRICESDETGWLLQAGFEAWGRLSDGGY